MNKKNNRSTPSIIGNLLNDLTHLEVNTIIKDGMTSAPPPTNPLELLGELLERYKAKLAVILSKTEDIEVTFNVEGCYSYAQLYSLLNDISAYVDSLSIRFEERYYILILRMKSFCRYIERISNDKEGIEIERKDGQRHIENVYETDLTKFDAFNVDLATDDLIKIRRFFDLGTEDIVMQTRFGIDGDIVSRIQREFANSPRQLVVDLHEKHTNMSLNYWKSLISLVNDLIQGIIKRRKEQV